MPTRPEPLPPSPPKPPDKEPMPNEDLPDPAPGHDPADLPSADPDLPPRPGPGPVMRRS